MLVFGQSNPRFTSCQGPIGLRLDYDCRRLLPAIFPALAPPHDRSVELSQWLTSTRVLRVPLDASMAHDGDDWIDGALSRQQSAHANQHPWRVQLTARMSRDFRECRDRGGDPDRGGLHRHGLSARHVQWPDGADEAIGLWKRVADGRHYGVTQDRPPAQRRRLSRISQPGAPWSD